MERFGSYIPTLRDETAKDGAPTLLWRLEDFAVEFVAEPEEQETDDEEAEGDGGAVDDDADPASGRFGGIDEPVGIPVGDGSAEEGVGQIGDGVDDPVPDVSGNELALGGWMSQSSTMTMGMRKWTTKLVQGIMALSRWLRRRPKTSPTMAMETVALPRRMSSASVGSLLPMR